MKKQNTTENQTKKVDEMSIADVLQLPLFFENAKAELTAIWDNRENARKQAERKGMRLKAHPIDTLNREGILEPGRFVVEFAQILNKVCVGMPRSQRDVIHTLGMTAFNKTVKQLLDNEKKGDKRKRANK